MPSLYVVTHTEATHHVDRLIGGWFDSELTARGIEQAHTTAGRLADLVGTDAARVVSSDLLRTRQTARIIGDRLGVEPAFDRRLREQSYGQADGTSVGTVPSLPPPPDGDRLDDDDGVPGSETRRAVAARVHAAVDDLVTAGEDPTIVVTHGGAATYVVTRWIGMPVESLGHVRFTFRPGSITALTVDENTHDRRVAFLGPS